MSSILHILPFAYLGGTEKDCYYIVRASKEHQHTVMVLDAEGPMCEKWQSEGAEVKCLNIYNGSNKSLKKGLQAELKGKNFDGIFYWSTIKLPVIRHALHRFSCKLAVHVGNPCQLSLASTLKQLLYHHIFPSNISTCLFACSKYVKDTLTTNAYYNTFELRVSLNPVELLPENPYSKKELSGKVIIGMTARLDPIKDHETVLKAFQLVHQKNSNTELWLVGDGMLREKLKSLAEELKISEKVVFWGNVHNVYELLQKMDIFVYATTPQEGLGNVVTEAMANGLPCVVSDLPMMKEIAGNKAETVIFSEGTVRFAENILRLFSDRELRTRLSENAFNRAITNFSAETYSNYRLGYLLGN